jgi:hypothetical protein
MNCSVTGNIDGQIARISPLFQAPCLHEFVEESRRCISGHHGVGAWVLAASELYIMVK